MLQRFGGGGAGQSICDYLASAIGPTQIPVKSLDTYKRGTYSTGAASTSTAIHIILSSSC
mgnify:CR=1 FL=1